MSTPTAPPRALTPGDVLEMPEEGRHELVNGRLVEMTMSSRSQNVGTRLARFLGNYCEPAGLAHVFMECGHTCFPGKPNRLRRPGVSCVRVDRLPGFRCRVADLFAGPPGAATGP